MSYRIAVVGASGNVGREILNILEERAFPVKEIHALASKRSVGQEVSYGEKGLLPIKDLATFDFSTVDIVLSSVDGKIAAEFAPKAAAAGAIVIDNSSHFRMDPDVPLIVPEVNLRNLKEYKKKNIIANPNCSTIQMVMALKPLHDAVGIKRVVVSTYQSTSGAGKAGMDELFEQSRKFFVNDLMEQQVFEKQIVFNVIPQIDSFMDDGMTKEEWKMVVETKKILGKEIKVCASCVRVPTFIGHAEMVNVELNNPLSAKQATKLWRDTDGITVIDRQSEMEYVTPVEIAGEDAVFLSRIREDISLENGLNFWCVADNLRKGAALNAVQIAEALIKEI